MLLGERGACGTVGEGITRGIVSFSFGWDRFSDAGFVAGVAPMPAPLPTGTATCPGPIPGGGVLGTNGTAGSFLGVLLGGDWAGLGLGLRERSMRFVEP
nr:hypothetical protein BaRGS_020815 [Batillaria attramentaria]